MHRSWLDCCMRLEFGSQNFVRSRQHCYGCSLQVSWLYSVLSRCRASRGYLKKSAKDILSITVVLEFLVGFYTFWFFAEFVIVPVLALLAGLQVVAKSNDEHKQVAALIGGIFFL